MLGDCSWGDSGEEVQLVPKGEAFLEPRNRVQMILQVEVVVAVVDWEVKLHSLKCACHFVKSRKSHNFEFDCVL